MSGDLDPREFPNLNPENCRKTSPATNHYNCIAWAANCTTEWWWPEEEYFWPENVVREETVSAFLETFSILGYEECEDGSLEHGYEKIALFARFDLDRKLLIPTHASRQLSDGWWTSKLGTLEDIKHEKAEDVNGPIYGTVVRFMRRLKA